MVAVATGSSPMDSMVEMRVATLSEILEKCREIVSPAPQIPREGRLRDRRERRDRAALEREPRGR